MTCISIATHVHLWWLKGAFRLSNARGDRVAPQRLYELHELRHIDSALEPLRLRRLRWRFGEPERQGTLGDACVPTQGHQVADERPIDWILER